MKREEIEEGMLNKAEVKRKFLMTRYELDKLIKLKKINTYNLVGHPRIFLKESEILNTLIEENESITFRHWDGTEEKYTKIEGKIEKTISGYTK